MDEMISMYIDNEMTLEEKIAFIERIRKDILFSNEAMDLLQQEKRICSDVVERLPVFDVEPRFDWKNLFKPFFKPMGIVASTLATVIVFILIYTQYPTPGLVTKRFVIFHPDVSQIEISGTFTNWRRIPMNKIDDSGYWEISLDLTEGEHRFAYILENQRSFADPTMPARELDDFGGENSVFYAGQRI